MKALIIEDETAAALNLEAILKQVAPGVEVIGTLESVEESIGRFVPHLRRRGGYRTRRLHDGL